MIDRRSIIEVRASPPMVEEKVRSSSKQTRTSSGASGRRSQEGLDDPLTLK